jgi:hypothetical protein
VVPVRYWFWKTARDLLDVVLVKGLKVVLVNTVKVVKVVVIEDHTVINSFYVYRIN